MHRIDTPSATPEERFTEGSPTGGVAATILTADWLNDVQESLCAVVEGAGVDLEKGNFTQLLSAIQSLITNSPLLAGIQVYSAAGSYTWNKPAGKTRALVTVVGAGAGASRIASAVGNGGAAGGFSQGLVDISASSSVSVIVGAAGIGRSGSPGAGTNGSSSSFGAFLSATGGQAGQSVNGRSGAGVGAGGNINITGGQGRSGSGGGDGGAGPFGGAGAGGNSFSATAGGNGNGPGAGGGGGFDADGGNGVDGMVIIQW